jgi:hypothetical protein
VPVERRTLPEHSAHVHSQHTSLPTGTSSIHWLALVAAKRTGGVLDKPLLLHLVPEA